MANLYDKASLVMIPSQYKEGKVYNIKPEDQSSSFEFERGSAATRVNSSGLIERSPTNGIELVTNGGFDTDSDWVKGAGYTISNGSLIATNAANNSLTYQSKTYPIGVYKVTANVTITNGGARFQIGGAFISESFTTSGLKTVYITVTSQQTYFGINTSVANSNFSIDNVSVQEVNLNTPRLDYSGTEPALLLEPQRTNELTQSEYFGADYTLSNTDIINNNTTSPEGLQNATKIYPLSSGNFRHIRYSALSPASGLYTFSIFAKAAELDHLVLIDYDGSGVGVDYNLTTGVATDNASTGFDDVDMIPYGDGWYRCIATTTNPYFYWILSDNGGVSVTVNGTDGLYIWGAQAEQGSYATSYIPTNGQAETRLADLCQGGGDASVFNDDEGVLFLDVEIYNELNDYNLISIFSNLNPSQNYIGVGFDRNSATRFYFNMRLGSTSIISNQSISAQEGFNYKIALKYSSGNSAIWLNGQEILTSNAFFSNGDLDELAFRWHNGIHNFKGDVKALHYFPEALTDTELQQLTTI